MHTIDCRPVSAQRSRTVGKDLLKVGGASLGVLVALLMILAAVHPAPSKAPSTVVATIAAPTTSIAPTAQPSTPSSSQAPSTDPDVRKDGGLDYLSLKTEAEEKLDGVLSDDHGVRYRDVHTKLATLEGGGIVAFCGEENSRSVLGGYGGFQRFIASRSVAVIEGQMEPAEFAQAWSQFCENAVEGPQVWF